MSKQSNYDTKSSIFSLDYKIPYDLNESSRIVEHLEESQCELQFLKQKLTEAYCKLEEEIKNNMTLATQKDSYAAKFEDIYENWQLQRQQNRKLKEVMEKIIKNRKFLEEEIQYNEKKYQSILQENEKNYQLKVYQYEKKMKKLENQIRLLKETQKVSELEEKRSYQHEYQQKINVLESQIKKITNEKVTETTRLRHEIECYKRGSSPFRSQHEKVNNELSPYSSKSFLNQKKKIDNFSEQLYQNNENVNILQKSILQISDQKIVESKLEQESIGKWKRLGVKNVKPSQNQQICEVSKDLTDDQKLTQCQIERKRTESQLTKIQRIKRPTQSDRDLMQNLEKKIYSLDSQISHLKRKIRQKY